MKIPSRLGSKEKFVSIDKIERGTRGWVSDSPCSPANHYPHISIVARFPDEMPSLLEYMEALQRFQDDIDSAEVTIRYFRQLVNDEMSRTKKSIER